MIRLERNYRSTGHILAAASHLIAHNEGRLGKTLRSEQESGEKVTVTSAWDSEEEARVIGEEIEQLQRAGHSLDEIAILVRASFQMREFEDRFVTLGLPYRVIGGPRFYERAEIRDALAYLRCINSDTDDLAFERIVNVPKRGLGDATIKVLHDHARAAGLALMPATRAIIATDELKSKPRQALRDLLVAFDRWREQRDLLPHTALAEIVLEELGYIDMWKADRSADAAGRLENLKELARSMEEFENLQGFLEHISLVMDADKLGGAEAVSIMTLHSAKGLEFDTVFLPGWEEGLLPHQRSLDDNGRAGLEEERRLAHVGLTRARRRAKIYFVANRRMRGTWSSTIPSRFVDELPEHNVAVEEARGFGGFAGYGNVGASRFDEMESFGSTYRTPGWQRARNNRGGQGGGGFGGSDKGGFRDAGTSWTNSTSGSREFGSATGSRSGRWRRRQNERAARLPIRPHHHRRRAGGEIHRHRLGFHGRRPGVPHEVRQRQCRPRRGQQAHHRLRPRRRKEGGGQLRRTRVRTRRRSTRPILSNGKKAGAPMLTNSRDIKRRLEKEGWVLERVTGSHYIFKHTGSADTIVLPHPKKDLGPGLVREIYKKARWKRD